MPKDEACIGSVGVLTVATRGEAGPGEVRIKIRGGTEIYRAWSETPIQRGTTVLVVGDRGARTLDVVEWEDLLGDSPGLSANNAVNPGNPSDGPQLTQQAIDIVRLGTSGVSHEERSILTTDVNGNTGQVLVDFGSSEKPAEKTETPSAAKSN